MVLLLYNEYRAAEKSRIADVPIIRVYVMCGEVVGLGRPK